MKIEINNTLRNLFGVKPCPYCLSGDVIPSGVGHKTDANKAATSFAFYKCKTCNAVWSTDHNNVTLHENGTCTIKSKDKDIIQQADVISKNEIELENKRLHWKTKIRT
jgi:hypothetical protein